MRKKSEIISLFTNIVQHLIDNKMIVAYKIHNGIILKKYSKDEDYLFIPKEYIDLNKFCDLEEITLPFPKIKNINEIIEYFEELLLTKNHISTEFYIFLNSLENLKDKLSPNNIVNESINNPSSKVKQYRGRIVFEIKINEDKRIILSKDYPITTNNLYEKPMINSLNRIWRGYKLHKNFVILEVTKNGQTVKCEFDCISVVDDVLCIFEIKNKHIEGISQFLKKISEYSKYIIQWLAKNNIQIRYVAPIYYIRDSQDKKIHNINKYANIIYFKDVLNRNKIKINVVYELMPLTYEVAINKPLNKELTLTKLYNENNNITEKNTYISVKISKEIYNKVYETIINYGYFDSIDDFIEFAIINTLNTIDLLNSKKKKH